MGEGPYAVNSRQFKSCGLEAPHIALLLALLACTLLVVGAYSAPLADTAPYVIATYPAHHDAHVSPTTDISLSFSEPVALPQGAVTLSCSVTQGLTLAVGGGPTTFTLVLNKAMALNDDCQVTVVSESVTDLDTVDPPDRMVADYYLLFHTALPTALDMIINEVDAVVGPGSHEFIELYDGGAGNTSLSGLQIVLYNGLTDKVSTSGLLAGYETDEYGYFLLSSDPTIADLLIADDLLLDGPAAIALYSVDGNPMPYGSPVTLAGVVDAVVYDSGQPNDPGLLPLLAAGEPQVDEASRSQAAADSSQRCPNAAGGQRHTYTYRQNSPTPGAANSCSPDAPPSIVQVLPEANTMIDPSSVELKVTFSEPVFLTDDAISLDCYQSNSHALTLTGGPVTFIAIPEIAPNHGELCTAYIQSQYVSDLDTTDPPDRLVSDLTWSFTTTGVRSSPVIINEVDTNTPGTDMAEFVELYDGGQGQTSLDDLTIVFFNGNNDMSYEAIGLNNRKTNAAGYFIIGSATIAAVDLVIPNGLIQNGPDAIALYAGSPANFPTNTPVTTTGLLDAVVYGSVPDAGLQVLLNAGQMIADENGLGSADTQSLQRCPNGGGGPRNTDTLRLNTPSPGETSHCPQDAAPQITATSPAAGQANVAVNEHVTVTFSEPVQLSADTTSANCEASGSQSMQVTGGPVVFTLLHSDPFSPGETCFVVVSAAGISDVDTGDPPDTMDDDMTWQFHTAPAPLVGLLINEVDADTPGTDRAEFIELYDGGQGNKALDGYLLVLFNGQSDLSYRTIDLAGTQTNTSGYLLLGGPDIPNPAIALPAGALQNGPDAIALYKAAAQQFPNGSSLSLNNLADALVYGTDDADDTGLLTLLLPAQPQIDENSRGQSAGDSNQRCPNGSGAARETLIYSQNVPTPGETNNCLIDEAPEVVALAPPDGAIGISATTTMSIVFSEPVVTEAGWLKLDCTQSGARTLSIVGAATSYTATPTLPLLAGDQCTGTIVAVLIHDADAEDPPDTLAADTVWTFTVASAQCAMDVIPISTIQGTGPTSPLQGQTVTTMGIVTADFREGLGGLFIQSPDSLVDKNPASPEGIWVKTSQASEVVAVGDRILVNGHVAEVEQRTALVDVEISAVCGHGEKIEPVRLENVPSTAAGWEALEGNLVTFGPATIIDNTHLSAFGELSLTLDNRPAYPTELQQPGTAARYELEANWAKMFVLDDGRIGLAPETGLPNAAQPVRSGEVILSVTGIVDGYRGGRRVHLLEAPTLAAVNPRPAPLPAAPETVRVASLDLGFFANGDGLGSGFANPSGAQSAAEYARQRAKVVAMIRSLSADIVAINGLENDDHDPHSAVQDLLDAVNAIGTDIPYQLLVATDSGSDSYPLQSAVFYRPGKVEVSGFDSASMASSGYAQPLFVQFVETGTGENFSVLLIHLDPRDNCPAGGPDSEQYDGQGCHNNQRTQATATLGQWLLQNDYATQTLILGNWNAYRQEDPLQELVKLGLVDLMPRTPDGYTTVRNKHTGSDHRLVAGEEIVRLSGGVSVWHINADESPSFDYRLNNPASLYVPDPYRAAEVDPIVIDLRIGALSAGFAVDTPVFIGEIMYFMNQSTGTGAVQFSWDFGDSSGHSTDRHPSYLYKRMGTYEVILTVTDASGSQTFSRYVDVLPRRLYLPVSAAGR